MVSPFIRWCVAISSAWLMFMMAAQADQASDTSATRQLFPSAMQFGRLLMQAGRLEHARQFLEKAQPANQDEEIERLFLLGLVERQLGLLEQAIERFETILSERHHLIRVRLELARTLYLAGRSHEAGKQFRISLDAPLPPSVEVAVERFLRSIDANKRWSVSLSIALLPETERPDRDLIVIGGVPFRLNDDATAPSGQGILGTVGLAFSPVFTPDKRGVFALSVATKQYEQSQWDDTTISGDVGIRQLLDQGNVAGGLRLGRRWLANEPYYRSLGLWGQINRPLTHSTHLGVDLSAGNRRHDRSDSRDGWRFVVNPRVQYQLNERTMIELSTRLEQVNAQEDHHGSQSIGFEATVAYVFDTGLSVSVSTGTHRLNYTAKDPLFGKRRLDRNHRVALQLSHRSLHYRGFAPYIGFSREWNRSNIPIHEFHSGGILAGVKRRF